jgi:putative membrane protein
LDIKLSLQHFLRASILLGFAVYISVLLITGDILQFIVPNLVLYVQIATVFLFIVGGFQFYVAILSLKKPVILCDCGHDHDHEHHHDSVFEHHHHGIFKPSKVKDTFIYSLFILPLLLAFLPNQTLSSSIVENRGMNFGELATKNDAKGPVVAIDGEEDPALREMFKTNVYDQDYARLGMVLYKQDMIEMKDEWFIEKLQSMNMFVDIFQEKDIKIKGFISREAGLASNQFIIARMGMTHCIADISPFGIIAEAENASQFADDSWVTLTGKISKTEYNGQTVIQIKVISAEPAEAPKVPYVYPDWEFASKL